MNNTKYWLLAFSFLVCACTCNRQKPESIGRDTTVVIKHMPATLSTVNNFDIFLKNLDTANVNNSGVAAQKFKTLFTNADTALADSAFVLFFSFYNVMLNYLLDAHYKDGTINNAFTFLPDKGIMATTQNANRYQSKLKTNGFALAMAEGNTYVKTDPGFVKQHFYPHVSATMRTFIHQLYKEEKEGFLNDAALAISPKTLAERLLFWENFLHKNPTFTYAERITATNREYLTFLLEGVDNTPLFNHQTKTLSVAYATAFEYVATQHAGSKLAALVGPYYIALRKNEMDRAEKILKQYRNKKIILDFSG